MEIENDNSANTKSDIEPEVNNQVESITNTNAIPSAKPKRQVKCFFSEEEDAFLARGLKKYGKGRWTRILKDPDYKFHPSRNNATLMMRAKAKNFI